MRRLPGPAANRPGDGGNSRGSLRIVSGLAENTNLIFCDSSSELEAANGCPVLREQGPPAERQRTQPDGRIRKNARSPERAHFSRAFFLTDDLHGWRFITR
jgi:hypothetical protein